MLRMLALLAGLTLAACTTAVSPETAFGEDASDSIVIVGVKLVEPRIQVHSISFVGYDPQTDESGFYGGHDGFFAKFQDGRPKGGREISGVAYFIDRVKPGPYS